MEKPAQPPHAPGVRSWRRLSLLAGIWLAWVPLFVVVYGTSGMAARATITLPMLLTSWFFRAWGAAAGSLLVWPLLAAAFRAVGHPGSDVIGREWPGLIGAMMVSGLTAAGSGLLARLKTQAGALAAERQALVAEIAARQRAEEALLRSHNELDRRVEERTADLAEANEALRVQISERERAEAELARKEEHEQQVLRLAPLALYRVQTDERARVIWIGGRVEQITGFPGSAFTDDPRFWLSRLHPEDHDRVLSECRALLEGDPLSMEYRFQCADGHYRWLHDEVVSTPGHDGVPPEAFGCWFDVTARRAAEEDLRYASTHANCLLWHAHVRERAVEPGEFDWDIQVFDEDAAQRFLMLDVRPDEPYPHAWDRSRLDDDRQQGIRISREALLAGASGYHQQFRCRRGDGEVRWLDEHVHIEKLAQGLFRLAGVATDITDLKQAQDALADSEARYRLLAENARDIIYRFRLVPTPCFEYVSPACTAITGYTPEEFYADPLLPQRLAQPEQKHMMNVAHLAGPGEPPPLALHMVRKDGQPVWLEQQAVRVLDESGRVLAIQGIIRDVTERRQLQERVQHAQKLESLGVLAGGIAHDFNNILTGILGNASVASGYVAEGSRVHECLGHIEEAALHAAQLTSQMLAYSGRGRFTVEEMDLSASVQDVLGLVRAAVSKKAVVKLDLAPEPAIVEGDVAQVHQVIMNLVINASEALGEGAGAVTVRTGHVDADKEYLERMFLSDHLMEGRYVFLEVADTGCGMDAETQARIFEPFFTTKFTGRGLGLAAVLGIVRGHCGAIRVYSEVGKGSLFRVLFPAVEAAAPAAPVLDAGDPEWRGSGTLLVVDDEEYVRRLARAVLQDIGFEVLLARDGQEALDLYRARADQIRAVVLDMTMPRLGGEEVAQQLRQAAPGLPILFSSGFTEQDVAGNVEGEGAVGFIQKPYTATALERAIRDVLEARAATA